MLKRHILYFILFLLPITIKAQVASGFVDQVHSNNWETPTALAFDTNGKMFVIEKEGRAFVVENNKKILLLDIREEVAGYGDYGVLGFALDPKYLENGNIYLYYVVDRNYLLHYGEADYDTTASRQGATIARVTRYTISNPEKPSLINDKSRLILIGETKSTGFPITGTNHGGGALAFGNDGTLFVSCGDGGLGDNYDDEASEDTIISEAERLQDRIYRCQILNSLNGKVIRINPANGDGISDNPFYDSNAPRSAKSRVWAYGLRNPFKMTVKPNSGKPGVLYVGDVGWNTREELNIVSEGGQNFGWPYIEGIDKPTVWVEQQYMPTSYKKPTVEWTHPETESDTTAKVIINGVVHQVGSMEFPGNSFMGICSIGGIWYTGTTFPEEYRNTYIFADFYPGWIKSFSFDDSQNPTSFRELHSSTKGIVALAYNPLDEAIYYIKIGFNAEDRVEIHKVFYSIGANLPPIAAFTTNKINGVSPLEVTFDGSNSTDPENTNLKYIWDFGDGKSGNGVIVNHTFEADIPMPKAFNVSLTVVDAKGLYDTTSTIIALNNTPPIIYSTSVDFIDFFKNNGFDILKLTAQVRDEDEPSNQLKYNWVVRLHHDEHSHPALNTTNQNSKIALESVPCDGHLYFYRVTLFVTDSYGLTAIFEKDIYPNCNKIDIIPPEKPILKVSNIQNNSFLLSWNNVKDNIGLTSYEVFINGVSKAKLDVQSLSYEFVSSTTIINKSFECYVKAIDFLGNFNESSKLNFTVLLKSILRSLTNTSDKLSFTKIKYFSKNEDIKNNKVTNQLTTIAFIPCSDTLSLNLSSNNFKDISLTLKSSNLIQSSNIISGKSKINYQAGNSIELLPGFNISSGSVFKASIQGCNN